MTGCVEWGEGVGWYIKQDRGGGGEEVPAIDLTTRVPAQTFFSSSTSFHSSLLNHIQLCLAPSYNPLKSSNLKMRFVTVASALLSLVSVAVAQNQTVRPGSSLTLNFTCTLTSCFVILERGLLNMLLVCRYRSTSEALMETPSLSSHLTI